MQIQECKYFRYTLYNIETSSLLGTVKVLKSLFAGKNFERLSDRLKLVLTYISNQ